MITRTASLFYFLLLLVGGGRMLAQTDLVRPALGDSWLDVQQILRTGEATEILSEQADAKITACHGDVLATYSFHKGILYLIEQAQTYQYPKEAQRAYDACLDYVLSVGAVPVDFYEDYKEERITATRADKVYRLSMTCQRSGEMLVTLSGKALDVAPAYARENMGLIEYFIDSDDPADGDDR